jgi:Ca-activated chloride channel family protein
MILQPVLPPLALLVIGLLFGGFIVWRLIVAHSARVRLAWVLRLVMVALLLVIAVRPVIPAAVSGPTASGGLEVYFVVDTTSSVSAEDWGTGQPRLDGVKADIEAIAQELSGAQFSLVTFDAETVQRVPLTTDATAIASAASVLAPEVSYYSRGSSIDEPLDYVTALLTEAADESPAQQRVLYYLGDGEQTAASTPESFAALAPLITGGAVLGYGTAQGARMLQFDGYADDDSELLYIQDYSSGAPVDAISRIDEAALETIAGDLTVNYYHRAAGESVGPAVAGIDVGELTVTEGEPGSPVELYWIAAIPLGLLALLEAAGIVSAVVELRPATRRRNP